jgi:hypothetical protein
MTKSIDEQIDELLTRKLASTPEPPKLTCWRLIAVWVGVWAIAWLVFVGSIYLLVQAIGPQPVIR